MTDTPSWVFTQAQAERALSMAFYNSSFSFSPAPGASGAQSYQAFKEMLSAEARGGRRNGIGAAGK
jgi:hypothetical protein